VVLVIVLTVNAGTSSLKAALFDVSGPTPARIADLTDPGASGDPTALGPILARMRDAGLPEPSAVGHRIVHGGRTLQAPTVLDPATMRVLESLIPWAPLHQPAALSLVAQVTEALPSAVQVGCFDTAFHASMPEVARRLPLADWLYESGVVHYGFHGLSYEHVVAEVGAARLGRAVVAHLGNGASLVAVSDGRSIDTTMGFSPDGGIPMGTRSGDLDPGVLLHLLDDGLSVADLRALVHEHAGLAGLSGGTSDMAALLAAREAGEPRAALAIEIFCRRIRMQIGAYAALLGGLDTLVFTGGIGEHATQIRSEICAGLGHLGIQLDQEDAPVTVLVVPADEELMIARHVSAVLGAP
jgi:acetate kinase